MRLDIPSFYIPSNLQQEVLFIFQLLGIESLLPPQAFELPEVLAASCMTEYLFFFNCLFSTELQQMENSV